MTQQEKEQMQAMYKRMQVGWKVADAERKKALRNIVTKDVMPLFNDAYLASLSLPPRTESGLVEFYKALKRVPN